MKECFKAFRQLSWGGSRAAGKKSGAKLIGLDHDSDEP
jgi:hypothetical protein